MAWLINVNGQYPDQNYDITISGNDINGVDLNHSHKVADIQGLERSLSTKAEKNHTHDGMLLVKIGSNSLTGNVNVNSDTIGISPTDNTIQFTCDSQTQVDGQTVLTNANVKSQNICINFSSVDNVECIAASDTLLFLNNGAKNVKS